MIEEVGNYRYRHINVPKLVDRSDCDYMDSFGIPHISIHSRVGAEMNQGQATVGRKASIESRMRQLEAELAELAKYGDDTYNDGDILSFSFQFTTQLDPEVWYTYATLKYGNFWYLTGPQHGSKKTWDELIQFWNSGSLKDGLVRKVTGVTNAIDLNKTDA